MLLLTNFNETYSPDIYSTLKDQVELLSWIFAGIMALISFFALFIGYMYENKLIAASKDLSLLLRPYTISLSDIRQTLLNYQSNTSGDNFISMLYWVYFIVTLFTIYIWGIAVGFYTNFKFSFSLDFSVPSVINFGIYAFYIILCSLLLTLTIALNQIRFSKNPLNKGYLPKAQNLCDLDFLVNHNGSDIDEIIIKNAPILGLHKNPPFNSPSYECLFIIPISMINYRFIIKLYDKDKNLIISFWGILTNSTELSSKYFFRVSSSLPELVWGKLHGNSTGEMKVFDKDLKVISRVAYKLSDDDDNHFEMKANRVIIARDRIENDQMLLNDIKHNQVFHKIHIWYS
jgi:hypothetical protein